MSTSHGSPGAAQLRLLAEDNLRSLAEDMRTKLPRELRDMIYSYVWDKDTVDGLQLPRFLSPHRRDRSLTRTPVAANRHIVGEQLATEVVEWLYSNYHDITIGEPNQLPKLLAGDLFGVGLKAKDCPLRRITTVVSTTGETVTTTPSQLCDYFAPLTTSKLHRDFVLHVRVCSTNTALLAAQGLYHVILRLKIAMDSLQGGNVAVRLTYEHVHVPVWDITHLVGVPPLELFSAMQAKLDETFENGMHHNDLYWRYWFELLRVVDVYDEGDSEEDEDSDESEESEVSEESEESEEDEEDDDSGEDDASEEDDESPQASGEHVEEDCA